MTITKYGHACLHIETDGVSFLTDPGSWNALPEPARLDAILITHEHGDHCDTEQVRTLLEAHPQARVITHASVGKLLDEAGIAYEAIEPGTTIDVNGVSVESCGTEHAVVYGVSPCRNTGYRINDLFIPGDALHDVPDGTVRVLALPTGGPWMKMAETIDYAKRVKPEIVFPIHDAMYTEEFRGGLVVRVVGGNLEAAGIAYADLAAGETKEF